LQIEGEFEVKLSVRAETFEGLRDKIFAIALEFGIKEWLNAEIQEPENPNVVQDEKPVASPPSSATLKASKSKAEKPAKRTKVEVKSPAKEPEAENQVESSDAESMSTEEKPPTADDVFEALKEVVSVRGEPTGRELLAKFGAPRRASLREDLYPAFIKECKARVLEATAG
jgi:hypothetical protein